MRLCTVQLFGPPTTTTNSRSEPLALPEKALALLGYLPRQEHPTRRAQIAALLWGETTDYRSRRNLTRTLGILAEHFPHCIIGDHERLAWNAAGPVAIDIRDGATLLASWDDPMRLAAGVALYRGEFLTGLALAGCPEFETWLANEREGWRRQVTAALARLVAHHSARGEDAQAEAYARRWLALEPWHEEAHRELMLLLARSGRRMEALAQYELCCRTLAAELRLLPSPALTALRERIGADALPEPSPTVSAAPYQVAAGPTGAPPYEPGPIIGRGALLSRVGTQLCEPDCRLVTLTGPGGIGKTRIAVALARQAVEPGHALAQRFPDGACFVPLAGSPCSSDAAAALAGAIAEALGQPARSCSELGAALRHRRMLLVLDSPEELLDGVAPLIDILAHAPAVTLLVASRERIHLREERLVEVPGLDLPPHVTLAEDAASPEQPSARELHAYGAIQLFLQRATAVRPELDQAAEASAALAICRLVEGVPLAIELAAALARTTPCRAIAARIAVDRDVLASPYRDHPARHRSLRAVFEQAWARLDEPERQVLRQAAIFRGGFTAQAASAILTGSAESQPHAPPVNGDHWRLHVLLGRLVDRSLLRYESRGRYSMPAFIRSYAAERLDAAPAEHLAVGSRHCRYYIGWLADLEPLPGSVAEHAAREELENLQASWRWAAEHAGLDALGGTTAGQPVLLAPHSRFLAMRRAASPGA